MNSEINGLWESSKLDKTVLEFVNIFGGHLLPIYFIEGVTLLAIIRAGPSGLNYTEAHFVAWTYKFLICLCCSYKTFLDHLP